jgi:hypothetical protein
MTATMRTAIAPDRSGGAVMVELIDGKLVASDAEEWRAECLARHVLGLPSLDLRRAWLADFERRHGAADATSLMEAMQRVHAAKKARAA